MSSSPASRASWGTEGNKSHVGVKRRDDYQLDEAQSSGRGALGRLLQSPSCHSSISRPPNSIHRLPWVEHPNFWIRRASGRRAIPNRWCGSLALDLLRQETAYRYCTHAVCSPPPQEEFDIERVTAESSIEGFLHHHGQE